MAVFSFFREDSRLWREPIRYISFFFFQVEKVLLRSTRSASPLVSSRPRALPRSGRSCVLEQSSKVGLIVLSRLHSVSSSLESGERERESARARARARARASSRVFGSRRLSKIRLGDLFSPQRLLESAQLVLFFNSCAHSARESTRSRECPRNDSGS